MPTPEFFNVQPIEQALQTLFAHWNPARLQEIIPTTQALGRVLASNVLSLIDLPTFRRSTMDGYAVRASDTYGASASLPAYLTCVGSVPMGAPFPQAVMQGQAVEIFTGGMLPEGSDAVVMVEKTQRLSPQEIEVLSPVAVGENVIQIGEDVAQLTEILPGGHRVRPQDIGGLLAVGILEVAVAKRPRVAIVSCGDELVAPDQIPELGQVRDINAYTLAALVEVCGGEALIMGIAQDHWESYQALAQKGFEAGDILVLTAGSSLSTRDLTRKVIDSLGRPGVLQHGLAVKPGKPTLLAICENKPVIGLPGNPVSALSVADQIISVIIERFLSCKQAWQATISAILATNIASTTGRTDRIPIRLYEKDRQIIAEPVFGKSNLIYTLVNADGWIEIPLNSNGLREGTPVAVTLYR